MGFGDGIGTWVIVEEACGIGVGMISGGGFSWVWSVSGRGMDLGVGNLWSGPGEGRAVGRGVASAFSLVWGIQFDVIYHSKHALMISRT